jgi:hypothetical protein
MTTFKLTTLVVALAAALTLASTAMGKGGGGGGEGGGASCAQIVDFSATPGSVDGQPTLTTSYSVNNACVDHENMSAAALDYSNSTTGFVGRAVTMLPYGPNTYTSAAAKVTPGTTYTTRLTVYTPGGKVADTRTVSVTIPAALAPAA